MPVYTIGLLSKWNSGPKMCEYFEWLIGYFHQYTDRIRLMLAITPKTKFEVAEHLLSVREQYPKTEIFIALTEKQWNDYLQLGKSSEYAAIIESADAYEVVPESMPCFDKEALYRFFIERCDFIVYSEYIEGIDNYHILCSMIESSRIPVPMLSAYSYVDDFKIYVYPIDRRDYRDRKSVFYNPTAEIRQSIRYLCKNGFSITSDHIPQIFLRQWLATPPQGCGRYLATPELVVETMRLRDTLYKDYLPIKVFLLAYAMRRDMWTARNSIPDPDVTIRHFGQFQRLLECIVRLRESGSSIKSFDIFDTDAYDKMLERIAAETGGAVGPALNKKGRPMGSLCSISN